jgi:hypothetical protein
MTATLSASPLALTVELPFADVARGARPPEPLSRDNTRTLGEAVGRDLQRLLGDVLYDAGMAAVGALYDVTEVLQPGLPCVDALTSLYADAMPGGHFEPSMLAIGGRSGRFTIPAIAPKRQPGSGPLLVLPLILIGPPAIIDRIAPLLEEKLLHTGQAGLDTTRAVQSGFGIRPENLTYATFNDLCALMKVQLDHGGFGPLWNLVENALFQRSEADREIADTGNLFIWNGQEVLSPFYTLSEWISGSRCPGRRTLDGYLAWLRVQRQFVTGLEAHNVPLALTTPDAHLLESDIKSAARLAGELRLKDQRIRHADTPENEQTKGTSGNRLIAIEHATHETGPVAFSMVLESGTGEILSCTHYYPVRREGLDAIRALIADHGRALGIETAHRQPGIINHDPDTGELLGTDTGITD